MFTVLDFLCFIAAVVGIIRMVIYVKLPCDLQ